jgi:catalase
VLANVDPELCAAAARRRGAQPCAVADRQALATTGRTLGIIVTPTPIPTWPTCDVRQAVFAAGMTPLIIAARGGTLDADTGEPVGVQRTFLTARSVEFDAILVAGSPAPAPDAVASKDAQSAATTGDPAIDPRVAFLLSEAYRHAKAIGAWVRAHERSLQPAVTHMRPGLSLTTIRRAC